MGKYKYIIWDIDGTLLDTIGINIRTLQKVLREELGVKREFDELTKYMAFPGKVTLNKLGIDNVDEVHKKWVKYVNEDEIGAAPYAGIKEVLDSFKNNGFIQAVASSKTKDQYMIDMVNNGFDKYMLVNILFEDVENSKPNAEPVLKAMERLGANPNECIYIGDTKSDYLCAKNAGVDFGLALWGCVDTENIDANYEFRVPSDILDYLINLQVRNF